MYYNAYVMLEKINPHGHSQGDLLHTTTMDPNTFTGQVVLGQVLEGTEVSPDDSRPGPSSKPGFEAIKPFVELHIALGAFSIAAMGATAGSFGGTTRWFSKKLSARLDHSKEAAKESIAQTLPKPQYDPLRTWQSSHRTRKLGAGLQPERQPTQNPLTGREDRATTSAMRANLRRDAIDRRRMNIEELERLYGFDISDKQAVKDVLSKGDFTIPQSIRMRIDSLEARKLRKSMRRINYRLYKQRDK